MYFIITKAVRERLKVCTDLGDIVARERVIDTTCTLTVRHNFVHRQPFARYDFIARGCHSIRGPCVAQPTLGIDNAKFI
jgi:hypothetical protein